MIVFAFINTFCAGVFFSIGIYALRKETPMWFYAGSEEQLEKETFHDVKEYNHKNGVMWITYAIALCFVPLLAYLFHVSSNLFLFGYVSVIIGGFMVMTWYWKRLYQKYSDNTMDQID